MVCFSSVSWALDEDEGAELCFVDGRLIDVIAVYEQISEKDVVADLDYSYAINFNSHGKLPSEHLIQAMEYLIQVQGVELREGAKSTVNLIRTSSGDFFSGAVEGFDTRLAKTLHAMSDPGQISHIEMKNESMLQVLNLFEEITGKLLIRGPGIDPRGAANLKLSNVSSIEALRVFDGLLLGRGIILTDLGDHFIMVSVRKPRDLSSYQLQGMGVFGRPSVMPVVKGSAVPVVRRVIIPKRSSQD